MIKKAKSECNLKGRSCKIGVRLPSYENKGKMYKNWGEFQKQHFQERVHGKTKPTERTQ